MQSADWCGLPAEPTVRQYSRLGIIWGAGIMMINGIKNEDFLFIIFNMLQSCVPLKVLFIIILIDYCQ